MNTSLEYKNLRELKRNIRNTKKRLVNDIMKRVLPYMWESGYCKNEIGEKFVPLKILCFKDKDYYKVKGMESENEGIGGFTEEAALITDAYGGGLATSSLICMPIETLINIWAWVEMNIDKVIESSKHYKKAA